MLVFFSGQGMGCWSNFFIKVIWVSRKKILRRGKELCFFGSTINLTLQILNKFTTTNLDDLFLYGVTRCNSFTNHPYGLFLIIVMSITNLLPLNIIVINIIVINKPLGISQTVATLCNFIIYTELVFKIIACCTLYLHASAQSVVKELWNNVVALVKI